MRLDLDLKTTFENNYFTGNEVWCFNENFGKPFIILTTDNNFEKSFCISGNSLNFLKDRVFDLEIDTQLKAKSKGFEYTTAFLQEPSIPKLPVLENEIRLEVDKLRKAVDFVSLNVARPILTGVNIDNKGNVIATNSFALYWHKKDSKGNISITLPKDFVDLVLKEIKDNEITIKFNQTTCVVDLENKKIVSNLINGVYPNIENIIPTSDISKIAINDKTLKYVLNTTKRLNSEYIAFNGCEVAIESDVDTYKEQIEIMGNDKNDFNFFFNVNYLNLLAKNVEPQEDLIYFNFQKGEQHRPIFVHEKESYFVVLPMVRR